MYTAYQKRRRSLCHLILSLTLDATKAVIHVSHHRYSTRFKRVIEHLFRTVYIKATAILCVITLITDAISTLLTGIGLKTLDPNLKYKFYRIAVLVMFVSLLSLLVALILYPVCFASELSLGNRAVWEFGWAYGVGKKHFLLLIQRNF